MDLSLARQTGRQAGTAVIMRDTRDVAIAPESLPLHSDRGCQLCIVTNVPL